MSTKKIIIVLVSLSLLCFCALKTSGRWISYFWQRPSKFQDLSIENWPTGINFKVPNPSSNNPNDRFSYFKTDEFGALSEPSLPPPIKAWIFGQVRRRTILTPPKARWTSHLSFSYRNFQNPNFSLNRLKTRLTTLIDKITERPQCILLEDLNIKSEPIDFKFPDLTPFRIWNEPAVSQTLYEWLCFFWTSPFCTYELKSPEAVRVEANKSIAPTNERISNWLKLNSSDLAELKSFLASYKIKLFGLILPLSSDDSKWNMQVNDQLRALYSTLEIPFLDGDQCFSTKDRDSLFWKRGVLSDVGNKEYAECVNNFFKPW
jgi:hypothetical protein